MKQKQPKLRFPEFSGDWESKMLGEISDIVRGASPRPIQDPKWFDDKSDVGWLRISDVTKQNGRIHFLSQRISKLGQTKTRVLLTPHLLLSIAATVGKPVINYVQTGVHDGFLIFLSPKFNIEFMFHWLNFFQPKWQQCGQPGSQVNLNSDLVKMTNVFLPTLQEQQKIGIFFKDLDDNIELNCNKLTELKDLKSSLLQKMFPKKGAKVPEVRFPEFSGDWEENKFNDLLMQVDGIRRGPFGSALKKEFFVPQSDYVVYEQQNAIYDHYNTRYFISEEKFKKLNKFALNDGDFIMSGAGTIGKISRVPNNIKQGVFNQALIRFRIDKNKTDSEYFLQFVRNDEMQQKLTGANPGSAITNLVPMTEVKQWEILIPKLQEQQKIGAFFKNLDELIEAQQNKLALLTEQKKALLQQMFV